MILFLDPSSTRTGYAVFDDGGSYVEAGGLPGRKTDPANVRIRSMLGDLRELAVEHCVTRIVIEDTSGKVNRHHGGGGAGLAIHGKAVGWFLGVCEQLCPGAVEAVPENTWTRGIRKEERALRTRLAVPQVHESEDLDALDAVGLGLWWFEQRRIAAMFQPLPPPPTRPPPVPVDIVDRSTGKVIGQLKQGKP